MRTIYTRPNLPLPNGLPISREERRHSLVRIRAVRDVEESSARSSAASPWTSLPRPPSISSSNPPSYVPISGKFSAAPPSVPLPVFGASAGLDVEGVALELGVTADAGVKIEFDDLVVRSLRAAPGGGRATVPCVPWNLVGNFDEVVEAETVSDGLIVNSDSLSVNLATLAMKGEK